MRGGVGAGGMGYMHAVVFTVLWLVCVEGQYGIVRDTVHTPTV